jgi:hypothetical protein
VTENYKDMSTRKLQRRFLLNARWYFNGNGEKCRQRTIAIAEELATRGHKVPGRNAA